VTDDNQRQSATLKVSISNYVGTATLALIAGAVALFTFIQQNYNLPWFFYLFMLLALATLVASFISGGLGADSTVKAVASGDWSKKTPAFNIQAILTLFGLIFILVAAGLGLTSSHVVIKDPCVKLLSTQLAMPNPDIPKLRRELAVCEATRS
jgi:hypothetical protein